MAITARRTQSNVELQPANQVRVREQDVSSGFNALARGIENVGSAVDSIDVEMKKRQQEDNKTAALEAYNNAQAGHDVRFNGENGFNTLQGKDSFEAMSEASTYLQDSKQNVGEMLENDEQREQFGIMMDNNSAARMSGLNKYVTNERLKYRDKVFNTTINDEHERIWQNPTDPDIREDALFNAEIALREKMQGQSEVVIQAALDQMLELSNAKVLTQLIETDLATATAFRKANDKDLSVAVKVAADKRIETKENQIKAFAQADTIIGTVAAEGGGEKEALALASKIENEDVRQDAESRLRNHYTDQRRIKQEAKTEQSNVTMNALEDALDEKNVDQINFLIANEDNFKRRQDMKRFVTNELSSIKVITDVDVESRIIDMIADPSGYQDNVIKYMEDNRSKISNTDWITYRQKFRDMQNSQDKDKVSKRIVTEFNQMKSSYSEIFQLPVNSDTTSKAGRERIKQFNSFKEQYQATKDRFFKEKSREPSTAEAQEIMNKLLTTTALDKTDYWFSDDKQYTQFEINRLVPDDFEVDEVPANYQAIVRNMYLKAGKVATNADIKQQYLMTLQGM